MAATSQAAATSPAATAQAVAQKSMPFALPKIAEDRYHGKEFIEPASGFSLLHTMHIGKSANDAVSQASTVPTPLVGSATSCDPTALTALTATTTPQATAAQVCPPTASSSNKSTAQPSSDKLPQAPHVVQHCEHKLRHELGTTTRRVFDIIAGRRRVNDLRRINIDPVIHAAILTLSKNSGLKGVALQSFHASASVDGKKVEFLGSCRVGQRVRAFTGTFRRGTAKTRPWVMTAFRVL